MAPKANFHCDIRASFATAFSTWRHKNNIPLKKIARDLGLSVSTINSWELGERFPTGRNFEMLVDYTGVPPCRIFWPSPSTGFSLQQNGNVANTNGWSAYGGTVIDDGTIKSVTISPPSGNLLFRLKK